MTYPVYSIIIPYYNETHLLGGCIHSISQSVKNERIEVIVVVANPNVDTGTLDDERVSVVRSGQTLSYPEAINLGVEKSQGPFLIFCDSDVYVSEPWFQRLVDFFATNEDNDIGIASCKLLDPDNNRVLDYGIAFSNYNSPHLHRNQSDGFPLIAESIIVQAACSACMMTTRQKFIAVGGFNVDLPYSYCDLDLCLRFAQQNWSTWVVATAIAYHLGDSSKTISGSNKNDVKSRFWALNHHRIKIDLPEYFQRHFDFFITQVPKLSKSYLLVDLSTVVDRKWYYDVLENRLGIAINDIYVKPFSKRDASHISLYGFLGWNILKLRFPLLFFTDDFRALAKNKLWWEIRPKGMDIVIDRNANFSSVENLTRL